MADENPTQVAEGGPPAPQKKSRRFAGRRSATSAGALGIAILLMITLASFYLKQLPVLGAGPRYTAYFTEAAGLQSGNDVRIAGIRVGTVEDVTLSDHDDHVVVHFRVDNAWVGDQTQATIQIKTVLGQKYLGLTPRGSERLNPDTAIPLSNTLAPYDVIEAFSDAASQLTEPIVEPREDDTSIDLEQTTAALQTLTNTFSGTAGDIGPALDGIARLSETISSRDQELQRLLRATKESSKILADRNEEFVNLIAGAGSLLDELNRRQQDIHTLLVSTTRLSTALSGIVRDNEEQIGPMMDSLQGVTELLNRQNEDLRNTIRYMAPFYRLYANVLGNGRWFEATVTNLLPPALPQQNTTRPPNMQQNLNNGGTEAG